jgi:predicted phosphoribosyltransferase
MKIFENRRVAGQFLAEQLKEYGNQPGVIVLALPRGGVPVAYEIARKLSAPLDVFLVRKLGMPGYAELAMGAIASGGVCVLNEDLLSQIKIPSELIDLVTNLELQELQRREWLYRGTRAPLDVSGQTVIIVDDGLATGSSMRAAISALRQKQPKKIVVAVPVGARESCDSLETEVDSLVCGFSPAPFHGVGAWYEDFSQTTDDEVRELLARASQTRVAA